MAVYKVPQDVEADDKLIGPFSFRQFVYLIIVSLAIALAWGLSQLFLPLLIIPLPVIVFFGALALPLRKDQPMEIYMAAMVSYHLKPRKRLWEADGIESLIEITAPKIVELQRMKNISQDEAQERFGYLADIVDSQGWAVRGRGVQAPNSAMNSDVYFEAQQAEDILDSTNTVAQSLDFMIGQSDAKRHQDVIEHMHQPPTTATPAPVVQPAQPQPHTPNPYDLFTSQQPTTATNPVIIQPPITDNQAPSANPPTFNPYPTDIQQSVIQPIGSSVQPSVPPTESTTSEKPLSPGIINLANNADLSIETIAREAHRIKQQEDMNEEVVISLR
ncbi:PrgI family protein [Candidatus Saccharibacteria bacterium]|nr:PrgI family protein [Candidatus Saccharibacteria bacterium]